MFDSLPMLLLMILNNNNEIRARLVPLAGAIRCPRRIKTHWQCACVCCVFRATAATTDAAVPQATVISRFSISYLKYYA